MPNSVRPHRQQPTRLPRPWDSPGKNTGVGCHFLLQCMKVKSESEVAQSCPTLSDPTDCSLPGSSHGIFQARVLEWVAIAFSYEILNVYCFQKLSFGVNLLCSNGDLIAFLLPPTLENQICIYFVNGVILTTLRRQVKPTLTQGWGVRHFSGCIYLLFFLSFFFF